MRANEAACPLCARQSALHSNIEGVGYFRCQACDFIFADPILLSRMDHGEAAFAYREEYWAAESASARERSFGSSLARFAEAVLYTSIPIRNTVDIGSGPGYLLDALSLYLPSHQDRFHAVEKFPPPQGGGTTHPNYHHAALEDLGLTFECGTCIEVLEHLTPAMARGLGRSIASVSVPGSLFLFNTGLTQYVLDEDPAYLDPHRRGHVTCWSVTAAAKVFGPAGFTVHPLRGKTWAFAIEFGGDRRKPLEDRIWTASPENVSLLRDPAMGEVMYLLGRESARAW